MAIVDGYSSIAAALRRIREAENPADAETDPRPGVGIVYVGAGGTTQIAITGKPRPRAGPPRLLRTLARRGWSTD